ncbi:MAG: Trm112 family protein [Terracidiphilus sp.]
MASKPEQTSHPSSLDSAVLALLACPVCHSNLQQETGSLICTVCTRAYSIIDGIPVLIGGRWPENEPVPPLTPKQS